MPRQPRLDAPGLLQHVMARGIERRKLFRDDKDRNSFLDRLAIILEETQTQCYAQSYRNSSINLTSLPMATVMALEGGISHGSIAIYSKTGGSPDYD